MVAWAAILDLCWLLPLHPDATVVIVGLNVPLALLAAMGYLAIRTVARRHPEAVVFAVVLAVSAATIASGVLHPGLGPLTAGYLLLLPVVVALAIPWATAIHVVWLAIHGVLVAGYTFVASGEPVRVPGAEGLLALTIVAIFVSLFGHLTNLRARVQSFVQIERIGALNRQAGRDRLRLDRLNQVLEQTARTDDLTGLRNRLGLRLDLASVRSRMDRRGESYALLMLDLDRFKEINDQMGHVAGDDVLRTVSSTIASVVRPEDGVYRYGGEEFVVLMRVAAPVEALAAAERIRLAIDALGLPHPGNQPHRRVTISVGASVINRAGLANDDDAWLRRADQALYAAKSSGRNRCEIEHSDASAVANPQVTRHGQR